MPEVPPMIDGYPAPLAEGGFPAWPLPLDGTGAEVARSAVRAVSREFGIPSDLTYDATVVASELATNALLHACRAAWTRPSSGGPELWAYLSLRARPEVVIKVFDSALQGPPCRVPSRPPWDASGGRGLEVVDALTAGYGGRWGVHPTRSRLGVRPTAGKAVFFTVPLPGGPGGVVPARSEPGSHLRSAERIRALLTIRGLRPHVSAGPRTAAIRVHAGVHIWIREESLSYRMPGGGVTSHPPFDEIEVVEQIVRHCEESVAMSGTVVPAPFSGPLP
ncbi:ATP-binding protein [Streptosporangium sp. NPDC051022]|uniref:ATP-binding protein n=1 Tax=Streptosporangium sp. NPDC051022 TaxID=3155752 RepID=UPI00342E9AA5